MDWNSIIHADKKRKIAFNIPFNNLDFDGYGLEFKKKEALSDEWIEKRMALFMKYTRRSLEKQTNQQFIAYVLYASSTEDKMISEINKYPRLPKNIRFVRAEDYERFIKEYIKDSTEFYEIELASDDMYRKDFVQKMSNYPFDKKIHILICQEGYIYSDGTGELAEYFNFSSCFNCRTYLTKHYINGTRYINPNFVSAIKMPHKILPKHLYINISHGSNVAFSYKKEKETPWGKEKAYVGKEIKKEKGNVLEQFM